MSSDPDREKGDGAGAGSAPADADDKEAKSAAADADDKEAKSAAADADDKEAKSAAADGDEAKSAAADDSEGKPEPIEDPVAFTINAPADRWTPDPLAGLKLSSPDIKADEPERPSGGADKPAATSSGAADKPSASASGPDKRADVSSVDSPAASASGPPDKRADVSSVDSPAASASGPADKRADVSSVDSPAASASGSLEISVSYPEAAPSSSGSLEIPVSGPESSASGREMAASSSGSLDVAVSSPAIPQAVPAIDSEPIQSEPISSARAVAAVAREGSEPVRRRDRIKKALQDGVSEGVETLGTGIETLGEGVTKIGDVTKKVPLVGANIGKLGEGLTKAGESIHALPRVAQTRRGRLLVRSVIVGFLLVFAWIAVIVGLQLRSHDTPDFRPVAEKILVEISKGRTAIGDVYEKSSPRFQEWSSKERFIDELTDLNATNGQFKEITAINETVVTKGRTGRVGRVNFTASYEHGSTRGTMSFHLYRGEWKLLGLSVEVPPALKITQAEREKRVAACLDDKGRDLSGQREKCDVRDAAETILEMIRDGKSGEVWDAASDVFKQQETRANFIRIQEDQRVSLGNYKRLLRVTEARAIRGVTATFDMLAEFDKASGVRVVLGFTRPSRTARWQLRSFKIVVPMPRPDEEHSTLVPPSPDVDPNDPPLLREATPDLEQKLVPPPRGSGAPK